MRSQFKPTTPAPAASTLSAPAIFALTSQIQLWMTGLALLIGMAILSISILALSLSEVLTQLPADKEIDPAITEQFSSFSVGFTVLYGGLVLLLMWRVWDWVKALTRHATSTNRAMALLRPTQRLLIWVRVIQVGPVLLFALGFALALAGRLTHREALQTGAEVFNFSVTSPGRTAGYAFSLLLSFLILDAVREWLRAVVNHARGSKNLISPKLGKMGGWTLLWYLSLGISALTTLVGTIMFFVLDVNRLPAGVKSDLTAMQAGLFSRLWGSLQGSMLMFFLITLTLIVLLTLFRRCADQVTTALDERSLSARRQALEARG